MKEKLRQYLAQHPGRQILNEKRLPSAVVVPIFQKKDTWQVLFIKRTETVEHHKGQISFPGGRWEPEDRTIQDTALRELHEEIGLPPSEIEILGKLDDDITLTSNYIISPFIGLIPYPYDFKHDPIEIAYFFDAPISALLFESNFREEEIDVENDRVKSYAFDYHDEVIWGATARILKQFLDIWTVLAVNKPGITD